MIKRTLTFIILLLLSNALFAQQWRKMQSFRGFSRSEHKLGQQRSYNPSWARPFGNYFMFAGDIYDNRNKEWRTADRMEGVSDTLLYQIFDWIKFSGRDYMDSLFKNRPNGAPLWSIPRSKIILCIKLNPNLTNFASAGIRSGSKHFPGYLISDSSATTIIAMGINAANVKDYRYHIVVDDSVELVKWSTPTLEQRYGAKKPYGLIGRFAAPGKQMVVEVVNIKDYSIRDGVVLDWRLNHKPVVTKITALAYYETFTIRPGHSRRYAHKFDDATGLPLDLKFPVNSITKVSLDFKDHETMAYTVHLRKDSDGAKKPLMRDQFMGNHYDLQLGKYEVPGKYEVVIQPAVVMRSGLYIDAPQKDASQILIFPFEIVPRITEGVTAKQLAPYILVIILLFIAGYLLYRQKLKKANQQKEMANLKLSSVRAQLNPHFMFNALTSIQNLMNQHDSDGANHYLAKFADLTRQVLNATGQELISLEDELKIINDYLQIEQLRFGFKYTVDVDKSINIANTEIPGMLMQPFIENAAKHGISGMLDKGKIDITIAKENDNLVLTITDNGKGFDTDAKTSGFGLKLGTERVDLLNQLYKNQPIVLQINSSTSGTTITIILTAWY